MNQCFEMRVADWPRRRWKVVLVMVDGQTSINCLLCRVTNSAVYQKHFLVYLIIVSRAIELHILEITQELSETDRTCGA